MEPLCVYRKCKCYIFSSREVKKSVREKLDDVIIASFNLLNLGERKLIIT